MLLIDYFLQQRYTIMVHNNSLSLYQRDTTTKKKMNNTKERQKKMKPTFSNPPP